MLCVVLEQGVSPCGTLAAFTVNGVRSGRRTAAPDGGTAGCVGYIHSLAEELSDDACVRGLCTACAGAGELKQGLLELAALDGGAYKLGLLGYVCNGIVEYFLLIKLSILSNHFDSSLFGLCGTSLYAKSTAHAVQRAYSHGELVVGLCNGTCGILCLCGSLFSLFCVEREGTDGCMRTYKCALVALDAVFCVPYGNHNGNAALLVCGSALRDRTVCHILKCGNGQAVAVHLADGSYNGVYELDKLGTVALCGSLCGSLACILPCGGNVDLDKSACAHVDSLVVLCNDLVAELGVGLGSHVLHVADSLIQGHDLCKRKECGLKYGILYLGVAHFVLGDSGSVDDIEADVVVCDVGLDGSGKMPVKILGSPLAVHKERAAGLYVVNDLVALEDVRGVVACNEICLVDVVGALYGLVTETQMGNGDTAGLLGVILEVCLDILVGMVADDRDGVLVRADGAVAAETPELAGDSALGSSIGSGFLLEGVAGNVVNDADGKAVLGLVLCKVVVYCEYRCRRSILGAETVAAADDLYAAYALACECGNNVKIQRLAQCAGLFCSVEDRDLLYGLGDSCYKVLCNERSVKTNFDKTDLFACGVHVVDDLFRNVADRAHGDDNAVSVGSAVVVEGLVVCAQLFVDLVHVLLNDSGESVVVGVASLSVLEEDVAVLGRAAEHGVLGVDRALSESVYCVHVDHILEVFVVPSLDLLDLVGGTEAVKEVKNGHSALDSRKVSNGAEVHDLLRVGLSQHCKSGLTACVYVGMIAENVQRMGSNAACGNVDNAGQQLAGDLVHVGDHEQQTLGCSVGGGERTGCKRAVNGACGACLGLHFHNLYSLAEDVDSRLAENVLVGGGPGVCDLSHGRGRRDGVDSGNFGERVRNVRGSGVAVHGYFSSCHEDFSS